MIPVRFVGARVARLATAGADGRPHLVPVTFAVRGDVVVIAIDHKPKTTINLRRLRNIRENDQVSLLVDEYDEDWSRLWWVRVDGTAEVIDNDADAMAWLAAKYEQYRERPPAGPVIRIVAHNVVDWHG